MSLLCPHHLFKHVQSIARNRAVQVVGGVALLATLARRISAARKKAAFAASVKKTEPGVVYIYSIPRMLAGAPSINQNATKIEAFCRVHKIPYVCRFTIDGSSVSPTETVPFISIDGELIGESQFCIDAIAKRFGIKDFDGLTPVDQATFTMVRRLLDNSMFWHVSRTLAVDNFESSFEPLMQYASESMGAPVIILRFMFSSIRKTTIGRLNASGLGWLSDERYLIELQRDVRALSALVAASQASGNKYLFGDKPTSADCLLYGMLSAIRVRAIPAVNGAGIMLAREDPTLTAFVEMFELEYFSDMAVLSPTTVEEQRFTA